MVVVVQMKGGGVPFGGGGMVGVFILCVWEEDMGTTTGGKCFPRRRRQADTAIRGLWLMRRDGTGWGDVTRTKSVLCMCVLCVRAGAGSELSLEACAMGW